MDKGERDITSLSAGPELQERLFKPSSTVPRTKSVLSSQKTKSKYLLEAERFLKEFREKERNKPSTKMTQKTPLFKPRSYQSTGNNYKEINRYIQEAEEILADLERQRKFPQSKPVTFKEQRREKYEEKLTSQ